MTEQAHDGLLVAVWIASVVAEQIAVDGGEDPSQLHITLLYFPDQSAEDFPAALAAVAKVCRANDALMGGVSGEGTFHNDGVDVHTLIPSIQGLADLRNELRMGMNRIGMQEATDFEWTPHITLQYEPTPKAAAEQSKIVLQVNAITVAMGDYRVDVPLIDVSVPYDMSEAATVSDSWHSARLRRFSDWFGYQVDPVAGSVASPSGAPVPAKLATHILAAHRSGAPDKKQALDKIRGETATAKALYALAKIDPAKMEDDSSGLLRAGDIATFVAVARREVEEADGDQLKIEAALTKMKRAIDSYKFELTKPPGQIIEIHDAVATAKASLPDPAKLAGDQFDAAELEAIVATHSKELDGAQSLDGVASILKSLRQTIDAHKASVLADKQAEVDQKRQTLEALKGNIQTAQDTHRELRSAVSLQPKTASDWSRYYMEVFDATD